MACWKRISVVSSLAAYLLATTAVHALHDHSDRDHCSAEAPPFLGSANRNACECDHGHSHAASDHAAHNRLPSPFPDCDHCFACRFLAVKAISAVGFAIVEQSEAVRQIEPREYLSAPVFRPDLPLSRGPPSA
jgi:hypothetical protein